MAAPAPELCLGNRAAVLQAVAETVRASGAKLSSASDLPASLLAPRTPEERAESIHVVNGTLFFVTPANPHTRVAMCMPGHMPSGPDPHDRTLQEAYASHHSETPEQYAAEVSRVNYGIKRAKEVAAKLAGADSGEHVLLLLRVQGGDRHTGKWKSFASHRGNISLEHLKRLSASAFSYCAVNYALGSFYDSAREPGETAVQQAAQAVVRLRQALRPLRARIAADRKLLQEQMGDEEKARDQERRKRRRQQARDYRAKRMRVAAAQSQQSMQQASRLLAEFGVEPAPRPDQPECEAAEAKAPVDLSELASRLMTYELEDVRATVAQMIRLATKGKSQSKQATRAWLQSEAKLLMGCPSEEVVMQQLVRLCGSLKTFYRVGQHLMHHDYASQGFNTPETLAARMTAQVQPALATAPMPADRVMAFLHKCGLHSDLVRGSRAIYNTLCVRSRLRVGKLIDEDCGFSPMLGALLLPEEDFEKLLQGGVAALRRKPEPQSPERPQSASVQMSQAARMRARRLRFTGGSQDPGDKPTDSEDET